MYFPYFVTYILIGFGLTLIVFAWALASGQFKDQQRARYLPLQDDPAPQPVRVSRFGRLEAYTLFFLASAGLAASAAVVIFALYYGG
jgi:cbb3-type cytochrome oxidase maturation protein